MRQQAVGPRQRRLLVPEQWLVPGRETHGRRAEDRNMDRHDMQATASYFDEHDYEPLNPDREARNNMLLELVRRVCGAWSWAPGSRSLFNRMDFEDLGPVDWEHHLPPPAAKAVVESLSRTVIGSTKAELKCPVCLLEFEEEETVIEMPCHHLSHSNCILPWLSKTNSCPLCRHELPTDDDSYEEHKKDKARRQQQQHRLENLHGAVYT
ncbi:E3 ubiquitin-protein ligase RNF181 [Microtus ochrogaster]|uniref:E3 ubiquitin-protein ligase RNF181 n=1 Tax=Microtus ochrogaster TaxID=79684 RepID=A0A8J6KXA2_MICOH|nr:E3 ubiquitin-protein ligase RNF181 [Microtus ochrogaster]